MLSHKITKHNTIYFVVVDFLACAAFFPHLHKQAVKPKMSLHNRPTMFGFALNQKLNARQAIQYKA